MRDTIFVTGATGTVGRELVKQLSARGLKVRAGSHKGSKRRIGRIPGVKEVDLDLSRQDAIRSALKDVGKLFILVPMSESMADYSARLVDGAKEAGVGSIVKLSTMRAGLDHSFQVARWHGEADDYLRSSGIPCTIVRPNGFMQNFINYSGDSIRANDAIYSAAGDGQLSFIDARDIASVCAEILFRGGNEGRSYELTGPEALSYQDAAAIFSGVLRRKISYVTLTADQARAGILKSGMPEWVADNMAEFFDNVSRGYFADVTETVEEITGRTPIPLSRFIADYADLFQPGRQAKAV